MDQKLYSQIVGNIDEMPSHGLSDLNNAELMNRVDTKYIVPSKVLPRVFDELDGHYSALEINDVRCFRYESTYFDTDDHRLYHMHHNGHLNRHKVRMRRYVDSDIQFLEVKLKNNKKRTIKNRIPLDHPEVDVSENVAFLQDMKVPQPDDLKPCLHNRYERIALASESRGERLTIDICLRNSVAGSNAPEEQLHDVAIAELKQARLNRSSPFYRLARELGIRPSGFSKYCMGMTLALRHRRGWKYNRFKPVLRRVARHQKTGTV